MSLLAAALPVVSIITDLLRSNRGEMARQAGVSEEAIGKVGDAVEAFLTKDERAMQAVMAEIDKARAHDTAMNATPMPPVVLLLRGLVRPLITLTAFLWYVYARAAGIALDGEDYAIIGGILAFWFGFRPFEKVLPQSVKTGSGKGATGGGGIIG